MNYGYHMRSEKPYPVVDGLTSSQGSIHSIVLGILPSNAKGIICWLYSTLYFCDFNLRGSLIVSRMVLSVFECCRNYAPKWVCPVLSRYPFLERPSILSSGRSSDLSRRCNAARRTLTGRCGVWLYGAHRLQEFVFQVSSRRHLLHHPGRQFRCVTV